MRKRKEDMLSAPAAPIHVTGPPAAPAREALTPQRIFRGSYLRGTERGGGGQKPPSRRFQRPLVNHTVQAVVARPPRPKQQGNSRPPTRPIGLQGAQLSIFVMNLCSYSSAAQPGRPFNPRQYPGDLTCLRGVGSRGTAAYIQGPLLARQRWGTQRPIPRLSEAPA